MLPFFTLVFLGFNVFGQNLSTEFSLPLAGNAYSSFHLDGDQTITNEGISNWTNPEEYFTVYFRISKPGVVRISLDEPLSIDGKSVLEFGIKNKSKKKI